MWSTQLHGSVSSRFQTLLTLLLLSISCTSVVTSLFINEIHYDNIARDEGESVEIAVRAGLRLENHMLVLYNGANRSVYTTIPLSGVVAPKCEGWGFVTVTFPTDGLENGTPDGLALIGPGDKVIEFLSYEGTFVAEDGPAKGVRSVDIGVQQSFATEKGMSLQKVGTGSASADFIWQGPLAWTFNSLNTGQKLLPPASPTPSQAPAATLNRIFVNEMHYRNAGTDVMEGIEIAAPGGKKLDGYSVVIYRTLGTVDRTIPLSGRVPRMRRGWGVVSITIPNLRNHIGVAIVDPSNAVVEFLSPRRPVVAKEGPATGTSSSVIPVFETYSTPALHSLQRRGVGKDAGSFTWVGPVAESFGSINNNQKFKRI